MRFWQRKELVDKYYEWLKEEPRAFMPADSLFNFVSFLNIQGYLREQAAVKQDKAVISKKESTEWELKIRILDDEVKCVDWSARIENDNGLELRHDVLSLLKEAVEFMNGSGY